MPISPEKPVLAIVRKTGIIAARQAQLATTDTGKVRLGACAPVLQRPASRLQRGRILPQ